MPNTKICYDKWYNGKPYPITYIICDICGAKYTDPDDAFACEARSFEPKFNVGDKVKVKYPCEYDDKEGIVLEVKATVGPKHSTIHVPEYTVMFPGIGNDVFKERELSLVLG
jgi:hypothetical protein